MVGRCGAAASSAGDVSEPDLSPDTIAAEDQAVAVARHLATCVGRHYRELRESGVPRPERFVFTCIWLREFCASDGGE